MSMSKFEQLSKEVGSSKLAGWITQHNPKVRARANATRRAKGQPLLGAMNRKLKKGK